MRDVWEINVGDSDRMHSVTSRYPNFLFKLACFLGTSAGQSLILEMIHFPRPTAINHAAHSLKKDIRSVAVYEVVWCLIGDLRTFPAHNVEMLCIDQL